MKSEYQKNKKRKKLIDDAYKLDENICFSEDELHLTLREIQELNPTKKELKDGLQTLMDCYL
jgi:hypothetical protein